MKNLSQSIISLAGEEYSEIEIIKITSLIFDLEDKEIQKRIENIIKEGYLVKKEGSLKVIELVNLIN